MCTDCGCSITEHDHGYTKDHSHSEESISHQAAHETLHHNPQLNDTKTISVIKKILDKNDHEASHNRAHFDNHNVLGINLMSSPGSGKTTLLENIADMVDFNFSVVEGDLETSRDADRLKAKGIEAVQIQTGSACHLDAFMVHKGLHDIKLDNLDVCFVENVGNLVCPASYDVGTHLNIVLVSIPEGEDKIAKYPVMFRTADLILFTKTDLFTTDNKTLKTTESQIEIYKEWQSRKVKECHHDDLETLIQSKLETYVWRLALILEMIDQTTKDSFSDELTDSSLNNAIILVEYFRENALRVYNKLSSTNPLDNLTENKLELFKELPPEFKKGEQKELFEKHKVSGGSLGRFLSKKELFIRVDSIGNYKKKFK